MKFLGVVTKFHSTDNLYSINFKAYSEKINIHEGSAQIQLRHEGVKVTINDFDKYHLDSEDNDFLKKRLLELIINYNKSISKIALISL